MTDQAGANAPKTEHRHALRRNLKHSGGGHHIVDLPDDHPAVKGARTLFPSTVIHPSVDAEGGGILKPGQYSRKLGRLCVKGKWSGMPIFSLTLEERATCPESCSHWNDCYGNHMHFAKRYTGGDALERRLGAEVAKLNTQFPRGFIVRLHVLGDFYSVHYVHLWARWLRRFPALHVFGYTAWQRGTDIGEAIAGVRKTLLAERFAIRFSDGPDGSFRSFTVASEAAAPGDAIVCPAQTSRTECCGTCGLCWTTTKDIAFLQH